MEKLTKEQVYVSITLNEEAVKLRDLLQKAGEPIFEGSLILRGLGVNECASFWGTHWQYGKNYNTKQVTLEQLAEILGVSQFKIGDRVRCKSGFSRHISSNIYGGAGYIDGFDFEIASIHPSSDVGRIAYFDVEYKYGVYGKALELVTEAKPEQFISVTRENLGKIHNIVCGAWQGVIVELLENADKFAVNVDVPLTLLKKAYSEANATQTELLKEIAPLPKEKVTVNVSRWCNIYEESASIMGATDGIGNSIYKTKEDAIRNKAQIGYLTTIELTGEYETEV